MNNDCKDYKQFGRADGISMRDYFEALHQELKETIDKQIKDLEKKILDIVNSNDKLYMTKFSDSKEAVNNAFDASQTAISKSEVAAEKRSDAVYVSLTELQKALASVVGRAEHDLSLKSINDKIDLTIKTLTDKIDNLEKVNATIQGKEKGTGIGWAYILGGASFVAALTALLLNAVNISKVIGR